MTEIFCQNMAGFNCNGFLTHPLDRTGQEWPKNQPRSCLPHTIQISLVEFFFKFYNSTLQTKAITARVNKSPLLFWALSQIILRQNL
jgi:hypothetical protein